jgi:hypothetical protein
VLGDEVGHARCRVRLGFQAFHVFARRDARDEQPPGGIGSGQARRVDRGPGPPYPGRAFVLGIVDVLRSGELRDELGCPAPPASGDQAAAAAEQIGQLAKAAGDPAGEIRFVDQGLGQRVQGLAVVGGGCRGWRDREDPPRSGVEGRLDVDNFSVLPGSCALNQMHASWNQSRASAAGSHDSICSTRPDDSPTRNTDRATSPARSAAGSPSAMISREYTHQPPRN